MSSPRATAYILNALNRIWVFSNHNIFVTAILALGCFATFGLDILTSIQISSNLSVSTFAKHTKEVIALFVIGAGSEFEYALVDLTRPEHDSRSRHCVGDLCIPQ